LITRDEFGTGVKAVASELELIYAKLRKIEELLEHIRRAIGLLMFMVLVVMIFIAVLR
jgi:nucleoside recognition membrane protein YjiH